MTVLSVADRALLVPALRAGGRRRRPDCAINMNAGPETAFVGFIIEHIDKIDNLVLENYGQQPVRFDEIHKVK